LDESDKGWPKPLVVRDGVGAFLQFCLENFEVSFWSCYRIRKMGELLAVLQKHCPVFLKYYKLFDKSYCDIVTNANGTPVLTPGPYFMKTLATMLTNPDGLRDTSAHPENTLIVDDSPHKNVRNNMWNVVHPTAFIGSHSQRSLEYLEHELMPWLRRMKESGQTVPDYCRNNLRFRSARLQEGDAAFTAMAYAIMSEKMVLCTWV
jgi:hypothetical protein